MHALGSKPQARTVVLTLLSASARPHINTYSYTAATCPTVTAAQTLNAHAAMLADANAACFKAATTASITIKKRKTCP